MINKNYIKLLRKKNENNSNFFIYEIISKRIIDSLDLIKVGFSNICEIGINENKTCWNKQQVEKQVWKKVWKNNMLNKKTTVWTEKSWKQTV